MWQTGSIIASLVKNNRGHLLSNVRNGKDEREMGLIKAAVGAAGGVMADQWREFFYCDSMDADILVMKGEKKTGGRPSLSVRQMRLEA